MKHFIWLSGAGVKHAAGQVVDCLIHGQLKLNPCLAYMDWC